MKKPSFRYFIGFLLGLLLLIPSQVANSAPGAFDVGADLNYTEDSAAIPALSDFTLTDGGQDYSGGSISFLINGTNESGESLTLTSANPVVTQGVISFNNGTIFRGNGTSADPIGNIDGSLDGTGSDLKINFTNTFQNGNFSQGITGWTVTESRVNLGYINSAGQTVASTSTISGFTPPIDNIWGPGTQAESTQDFDRSSAPNNTYIYNTNNGALNMSVTSGSCSTRFCVLRGPYVVSDASVYLSPGDDISFDWAASSGGDAFDVYGYLVNTQTGKTITLINETGRESQSSGGSVVAEMGSPRVETNYFTSGIRRTDLQRYSNSWTQGQSIYDDAKFSDGTNFTAGSYKFVFIAGSYDDSGGRLLGATFSIDNVTVTSSVQASAITASDVEQIARLVNYSNTTGISSSRTLTFSSSLNDTSTLANQDKLISVTQVNDGPAINSLNGHTYNDTAANNTFSSSTGNVVATDEEGDVLTYSITGGTNTGNNSTIVGSLGSLTLNRATGAYTFIPNTNAMNAANSNTSETFTIGVSDGQASASTTLTITLNAVVDDLPSAPIINSLTAGDQRITVSFSPPASAGSSSITNYEYSTDGQNYLPLSPSSTNSPFVITELSSDGVTLLQNGVTYTITIKAINSTGSSPVSNSMTATPAALPSAPTITSLVAGDRQITIYFTPPLSSGTGQISNYEYTTDGQTFHPISPSTTSSPATIQLQSLSGNAALQNGVSYSIKIRAVTQHGTSAHSNLMVATPVSPLGAALSQTGFSLMPKVFTAGTLMLLGIGLSIITRLRKKSVS